MSLTTVPPMKHTSVSSFSRKCHERVLVELLRLVIGSFENCGTSHCGFGGRNDGVVFASKAEKDLPLGTLALDASCYKSATHILMR